MSAEAPFPPKKSAELRQFLSIVIPSRLQDIVRRGAEARGFAAHGRLFFGLLLVLIAATGFVFKEQICRVQSRQTGHVHAKLTRVFQVRGWG